MTKIKIAFLILGVFVLCLTISQTSFADMTLDVVGGGLGQPITFTMTGPPNDGYFMIMSLSTGPTITPWITLDVGLDLITFSGIIPGFMGHFSGSGVQVVPLSAPFDPNVHGLNLNFQNCLLPNMKVPIIDKSNLYRVTFQTPGTFAYTLENLPDFRGMAATAKLDDGSILIAGGLVNTGGPTAASDEILIYKPNLEAFSYMPCTLPSPRSEMTATTLHDGRVLLLGGLDSAGATTGSAWILDPVASTISNAGSGSMSKKRFLYEKALLDDGRVIIMGGCTDATDEITIYESLEETTEIYDPVTNQFTAGPKMGDPRGGFTATKLDNGEVLIAGGLSYYTFIIKIPEILDTARIYTPNTGIGSFSNTGDMGIVRGAHGAKLLSNGNVLIISGGTGTFVSYSLTDSCEVYNTSTGKFISTGDMIDGRVSPAIALLPDGTIIAMGGGVGSLTSYNIEDSCEIYDPVKGEWTVAPSLLVPLFRPAYANLSDGTIFIGGGMTGATTVPVNSAEIYQPE